MKQPASPKVLYILNHGACRCFRKVEHGSGVCRADGGGGADLCGNYDDQIIGNRLDRAASIPTPLRAGRYQAYGELFVRVTVEKAT